MKIRASQDEGLRARKRATTQATIERAAVSLALKHGYEKTTVDMICDAGMVSQRTFFNYFGSKERVILGSAPPMPTNAATADFINGTGPDVLGDLVETITTAFVNHEPDAALLRSRRAVIRQTPELASKEIARIAEAEDQFVHMVLARFQAQGRNETTTPDLQDEAKIIVSLAVGVVHFAVRKWFSSDLVGTPQEVLRSSIQLLRRVTHFHPLPPTESIQ
ncbi:MAG: TetR/AcrR family transcriptional regulator [Lacisediminihabitans sp.]